MKRRSRDVGASQPDRIKNRNAIDEVLLKEKGIGALVSIDDTLVHLLTGLNADQYAAEMTGQIAGG